jgi:hypothetical protein
MANILTTQRLDALTTDLSILKVSEWLIGLGVLTRPDPRMLRQWHRVSNPLRDAAEGLGSPASLVEQIIEHLEFARAAMRHTHGLRTFFEALARAQDAALAAMNAGFDEWPMAEAFNMVTRIIAASADIVRQEVMRRILNGKIDAANAEKAWAMLNDPRWNDQCIINADMGRLLN